MTSNKVKQVTFEQTGGAEVLQICTVNKAEPGRGEIRIKAQAIGLNRAEVMFRNGAYLESPTFPSKLGYEVCGVVDAVGEGVVEVAVGDVVGTIPAFSMGQYGVYGEYPIVPVHAVAICPPSLTTIEGAAVWMQYITAYGALIEVGNLRPGQTILITAASSSVGIAAIQTAKLIGATVIATSRTREKLSALQAAGADYTVHTEQEPLDRQILKITGNRGVDLIFDPIGGPLLDELGTAAAKGGTIIEYGALDERPSVYPLFQSLGKGLSIIGYTIFETTQNSERLARAKSFVFDKLQAKQITPLIDKVFEFADIQNAHRYMENNNQLGKIVVRI